MTRSELNRFEEILDAKYEEVVRSTGRREGITVERTPDAVDALQLAAERELTSRGLERESKLLRDVRAALNRIADGNYGTCLECEEEISHKRLNAMPWATLCIKCQEHADGNFAPGLAYQEPFLKAA